MKIPFMNLAMQTEMIQEELWSAWQRIVSSNQFINGPDVEAFEKRFSEYCEIPHTVGVSNGTDALVLAFQALEIGRGDIVITVPNTFIATTEAITAVGAEIRFVDIDPETMLMDVQFLSEMIEDLKAENRLPKAIVPVHLFGQMCEMEAIQKIAERDNIKVVEDASQAHGARHKGKSPGYYGDIATYSFYPGKNLGAFGDAGAVVTRDEKLARWMRMAANHGREEKYLHSFEGKNNRMDTIQAAVLLIKLKYLEQWTEKRISNAESYDELFQDTEIVVPKRHQHNRHVYHLYVVRYRERDAWQKSLSRKGISTGIHYPVPLHLQPAYTNLGYRSGDFPITEKAASEMLSLPVDDRILSKTDLPSGL